MRIGFADLAWAKCRDGSNDNFSWNCGVEGETDDEHVRALRQRQMRNMHMALMLSQGTPMVLMGELFCPPRFPGAPHAMQCNAWAVK